MLFQGLQYVLFKRIDCLLIVLVKYINVYIQFWEFSRLFVDFIKIFFVVNEKLNKL